jgi:hypothetical protein
MGEQRNRLRPWRPPQQSGHRQCVFFSLPAFGLGAFLTLPRTKPDDTAAERRSISASRNALILEAAMASPPQIARASFIFDRIGGGRGSVCATGHCFDAFFRSELTEGAHAGRYSHPRSPNAERSTPGGAYHPPERYRAPSFRATSLLP